MSKHENFVNPPITEAIIDVRIERPLDLTLEVLEKAYESIKSDYPQKKTCRTRTFEIKSEQIPTSLKDEKIGYHYLSADSQRIAQFRLDGFTFNRLRPYSSWDEMSNDAKKVWHAYSASLSCKLIRRLAVRYINAIEIPFSQFELDEYFTLFPKLPNTIENQSSLEHFFTKVTIGFKSSPPVKAHVVQTIGNPPRPDTSLIIMDIDVFIDGINSQLSADEMWNYFIHLRNAKNNIFFGCITEKTKNLFKK